MNAPELSIRRPVATTLVMAALIVFGLLAYRSLPVSELPNVDFPTIEVTAGLPGASPETMASSVATPLESQLARIGGIESMTSVSALGTSRITMQFALDRDIDAAALDVQSALSAAVRSLPQDMPSPPAFRKINPADFAIYYIGLSSPTLPLSALDEYADTMLSQRISAINGVAQVQIWGSQKYAVRVQVNPDALAIRGIGLDEVATAIRGGNTYQPTGSLSGRHRVFTVQTTGKLNNAADYNEHIVTFRNGAPVRLKELGRAIDGIENDKIATWINGTQGILVAVYRQPGSNTIKVVDELNAMLPQFRQKLPASVNIEVLYDRAQTIRSSIEDVQFTLVLAAALVVMVIFLFLRNVWATVIAGIALPISIVGTFGVMYLLGFSVNNLSLMALTLAVGYVVDDAIVMLENIVRHVEKGEKPFEAALKGSREIGFTIISMTVSLIAAFIPVIFMGGMVGRLLHEFAVTISAAILVSGFVSLTLTPMLCSRFARAETAADHGRLYRVTEAAFDAMLRAYDASLKWCLKRQPLVFATFLATLVGTGWLFAAVSKDFLPAEDTGRLIAFTEGGQDVSFDAMVRAQKQVAAIAQADPNVDSLMSRVGASGSRVTTNQGLMLIRLKPRSQRDMNVTQVVQQLRRNLSVVPGLKVFVQNPPLIRVGGRLSKAEYEYTLQDIDLDLLYKWADVLEQEFRKLPGFQDVNSDLAVTSPTVVVEINRNKAARMGITAEQIELVLASAFGTRQVSTIYTHVSQYKVILEVDPSYQNDPSALGKLYVRAASGQLVPLDAISTARRGVGPLTINHQAQLPSVTISFNLAPDVTLGTAVDRIRKLERDIQIPATLTTDFQGTAKAFESSLKGMTLLLIMAVLVVYIVLGILYESFVHPLTILSGLPAAGVGALLALIYFNIPLSLYSFVGIIMLIGIVKKNAIMMIDFALEKQRTENRPPDEAIYEACLIRFRPIMMTTMAALVGILPIAVAIGDTGDARQPLGIAVVGGLVLSQFLTLYLTPVIYLYLERAKDWFAGAKRAAVRSPHPDRPPTAAE